MHYDDEMTERAVRAFMRPNQLTASGKIIMQPCRVSSYRRGNVVTLANVNGILAKYKVLKTKNGERLRRMAYPG